jgi:hypothetical protein
MTEPKHAADAVAGITGVGAWLEVVPLPELAALATLCWYGARLTSWAVKKWRARS